jgi:hypothetical protein
MNRTMDFLGRMALAVILALCLFAWERHAYGADVVFSCTDVGQYNRLCTGQVDLTHNGSVAMDTTYAEHWIQAMVHNSTDDDLAPTAGELIAYGDLGVGVNDLANATVDLKRPGIAQFDGPFDSLIIEASNLDSGKNATVVIRSRRAAR